MITLISNQMPQYKANLHSHSTLSDGRLTPEEMKAAYKAHGYQILSVTDHEYPHAHNDMTEPDFLMITGYEAYIRPDKDCHYNRYTPEIHLNLFARNPENEAIVNYNSRCCKYAPEEVKEAFRKVGSQRQREYSLSYIQEFIDTARANGYIVSLNHPQWSMDSFPFWLSLKNCFSMEMCNFSCQVGSQQEYNAQLYDAFLRQGTPIFCHSADDNHNGAPLDHPSSDSFGGFAMILADELTYGKVFTALEKGDFYSSMGPVIKSLVLENGKARITCSEAHSIIMHYGAKSTCYANALYGAPITEAEFDIPEDAPFLQFCVTDERGNHADTRGYFAREWRDEIK